jgi:RimJ/RimL family protein N-acetyltransferase
MRGERIMLAPLGDEDSPVLFRWINDHDTVILNAAFHPVSEGDHQAWFDSVRNQDDVAVFGIRLLEDNRLIGSCQLLNINPDHRTADLQIRIGDPPARGRGHGTEAVALLLSHAFHTLKLRRVALHVFATNAAALRLYETSGFRREGILRSAALIDGIAVDVVVMGILAQEFGN